jgi:hypothetical protein
VLALAAPSALLRGLALAVLALAAPSALLRGLALAALALVAPAALLVAGGCGDPQTSSETAAAVPRPLTTDGLDAPAPAPAPELARYYEAYLAETLRGDVENAREGYREVMDSADSQRVVLAARAALHLAELEAWRGNRREAIDLVARATALGEQDRDIVERADQLQDGIAALQGARSGDVRGPSLGKSLKGASEEARAKFAKAEKRAATYYKNDVKPRIEDPQAGARSRQRAVEVAERAYRAVTDLGEPTATVAAEFRIGSLYHDLAVALVSEQPPELLDRRAIGRLRRQQEIRAARYLRTARAAYRRSLVIEEDPASDRWRRESEKGLQSVEVLLRGTE